MGSIPAGGTYHNSMKFDVVLFDADGMTLNKVLFSEVAQKEYGLTWDVMRPFFKGVFNDCKVGKADLKEELVKVLNDWGWKGTVEELVLYWFSIGDEVNTEIAALVKELRAQGTKCYLTSNQEKYRGEYLKNEKGLGRLFDGLFLSAEMGVMKENPEFFKIVLNSLGNPNPSTVLLADDAEENLKSAESLGIKTFTYSNNFSEFEKMVR